jgi:calcium-dependent protein kinase
VSLPQIPPTTLITAPICHKTSSIGSGNVTPFTPRGKGLASGQETPIKKLEQIENAYQSTAILYEDKATSVYLAKHLQTGLDRVIKRVEKIKRVRGPSQNSEDRLRREVRMLSSLDHPNILKLYEVYEDKLYFYLVSEALTGGYLMDYLTMERNLSERLAAKIIVQVMKALAYCNSRGVLHRNLRMDSLILQSTPTDSNVHVLVQDVGSAMMTSAKDEARCSPELAIYIAPESIQNEPTESADVWSCGVILHMLLCGNPPFHGGSAKDIYSKIANQNVVFPQGLWAGVSSEAIHLLRGMLNKDPAARLSLTECLNHPWIHTNTLSEYKNSQPILTALRNLKVFEAKKRLKQAILSFISAHINQQEETKVLRDAFFSVDVNGDGLLSREELIAAYSQTMTRDEAVLVADKVMRDVDLDHSGYVDYSEFMLAGKNNKLLMTSRNLRIIFQLFDTDNSGKISFSEFKQGLKLYNVQASDELWGALLLEADLNHDGELNCYEFSRLLLAAVGMEEGRMRR